MKIILAFSLVLLSALGTRASADECTLSQQDGVVRLSAPVGKRMVMVTLSNAPTTRARITFQRGNEQHSLEWDPALDPRLSQSFITALDPKNGSLNVSVAIDPTILKQANVATTVSAGKLTADKAKKTITQTLYVSTKADGTASDPQKLGAWPQPTFTIDCVDLPNIDAYAYAPTAGGGAGARGFGTIPEPIAQTLALLGEIALERAKAGALQVLKDRFVKPLCGDDEGVGGVRLKQIGLVRDEIAFPKSCQILRQLRLQDVLASGKPLLRAVRDDLRSSVAPSVINRLAGDAAWGTLAVRALDIVNRAIDRGSFSVLDAEAAFDLFIDATPFLHALPLLGDANRKLLGDYLATITACQKDKAGPVACASNMIATKSVDELRNALPPSGVAATKEALDAIKQLEGVEAGVVTQLKSSGVTKDEFKECANDATLERCVTRVVRSWKSPADAIATFERAIHKTDVRAALVKALLHDVIKAALDRTVAERTPRDETILHVVQVACTARLGVGIVRRCTTESCTSAQIRDMFDKTANYFGQNPENLSDDVCWTDKPAVYRTVPAAELTVFEGFVVDGLELVADTAKQTAPARAAAVIRTLSRIGSELTGCAGESVGTARCRELAASTDLLTSLVEEDHTKALAAVTELVHLLATTFPASLTKGVQLIGSVAAYAQVFEDTKTQDAATATAARKKALENLIDSATDRHGRAGEWVFSLGSNVGMGYVWTAPNAKDPGTSTDNPNGQSYTPQLRLPIGFAYDLLPKQWSIDPRKGGLHLGATIGDLGQFAAVGPDGKIQPVRWDNFLSPGIEVGFILGAPEQAINLTLHAEYTPALYQTSTEGGAWRIGLTLGYYIPFFDFN